MYVVSTPSGLIPALTFCKLMKLLIINPAPTSSTSESAISAATSRLRRRCCPPPAPLRPPSFSVSFKSGFEASSAGAVPNTKPVNSEHAAVNPNTRPSRSNFIQKGMSMGIALSSRSSPHSASTNPSAPLIKPSSKLSVSSCRKMRLRFAPSAARIAISFCRAVARASNRLATFTQAINNTKPTTPSRIKSAFL